MLSSVPMGAVLLLDGSDGAVVVDGVLGVVVSIELPAGGDDGVVLGDGVVAGEVGIVVGPVTLGSVVTGRSFGGVVVWA